MDCRELTETRSAGRGLRCERVTEMCAAAGIAAPEFEEITGAAVVTFRVPVSGAESTAESGAESRAESLDVRILAVVHTRAHSKSEIAVRLGGATIMLRLRLARFKSRRTVEPAPPRRGA